MLVLQTVSRNGVRRLRLELKLAYKGLLLKGHAQNLFVYDSPEGARTFRVSLHFLQPPPYEPRYADEQSLNLILREQSAPLSKSKFLEHAPVEHTESGIFLPISADQLGTLLLIPKDHQSLSNDHPP